MTHRAAQLRLGGSLLALAAGAAAIVVAVALLRSVPGPISTSAASVGASAPLPAPGLAGAGIATPNEPGFPAPPLGAIVLAREAGSDALGFAIVPGTPHSLVQVSVVSPEGPGVSRLEVAVAFGKQPSARLTPCGSGCYQAEITAGASRQVTVSLGAQRFGFTLPARRRPADATAIVGRATAVWRALKTLVWHERLASSPTDAIHTLYEAVAPDELSYTIRGLSAAVIIGSTIWERTTPTGPWLRNPQVPIRQPLPFWYGVVDARLLGATRFEGRSVWIVSFFDPTTPAWFEAEIDKRSGRTLELSMTAASHFMHDLYGPFDAPLRLHAPSAGE